jgi:hypothetical protein
MSIIRGFSSEQITVVRTSGHAIDQRALTSAQRLAPISWKLVGGQSTVTFTEKVVQLCFRQSQSHFTADTHSVYLGIEPTLWTFEQEVLPFQEFWSGICFPVSVGCPLWWQDASGIRQSHFTADSQYILVSSPLCGLLNRNCFLFKSLGLEFVVLSLWGALSDKRSVSQSQSHFTTDSQSVYLGIEPTLWTFEQKLFLFKSLGLEFVVLSLWGALSDERSVSQSHFTADSHSVYLGIEPTLWTFQQKLFPFQEFGSGICCPVSVGRPLWREAGSVLCKSQFSHLSVCTFTIYIWPPLWSGGQRSWLQIRRSRVRFSDTTRKKSSGSGTGSTQPREYNWGATWKK